MILIGEKKKEINVRAIVLRYAVFAIAVAVALVIFIFCRYSDCLAIGDYINIRVEGAEGYGIAFAGFDSEKLAESFSKGDLKLTAEGRSQGLDDMDTLANYLNKKVTIHWNPKKEGLSNGDTVGYSFTINKDIYKYVKTIFKADSKTYIVEGLENAAVFDPFENVRLEYMQVGSGYSASICYDGEYLTADDFELSEYNGLKEGQKIKITLKNTKPGYYMESFGVYPTCLSKEIVVQIGQ